MPEVDLDPKLVFFGVLPPLLYGARSSRRSRVCEPARSRSVFLQTPRRGDDCRRRSGRAHVHRRSLVGCRIRARGDRLPTDPLAATSIARRLGVPRKLVTIVEGESLVNDGTARPLSRRRRGCRHGSFSAYYTGGLFLVSVGGGIAVGLAVGWLVRQVRSPTRQPSSRDHDLVAHRLRRVHSGGADGGLGRARRRYRRRDLPRLVHAELTSPCVRPRGSPSGRSSSTS